MAGASKGSGEEGAGGARKSGKKKTQSASVGFRRAHAVAGPRPAKVDAVCAEAREKVRESQDGRRQRVWDKLDEARRLADAKRDRLKGFASGRGPADGDDRS